MTDVDRLIAEFRSDVAEASSETGLRVKEKALERGTMSRRVRPTGTRWGRPVLVLVSALALAGAAAAAVAVSPWWSDGSPAVDPEAVARLATDNAPAALDAADARTVAADGDAALVAAPLNSTGYCLMPTLDGTGGLGAQCQFEASAPDDAAAFSLALPADKNRGASWLVYGRVTDVSAQRVDLGAFALDLKRGGFFLARIPEGRWAELAGTANAGAILAADGTTLRSVCVNWGAEPGHTGPAGVVTLLDGSGENCQPIATQGIPSLDLDHAEKLVTFTLTHGFSIWKKGDSVSVWRAFAENGTVCTWVGATSPAPSGTSTGLPGGGQCSPAGVEQSQGDDFDSVTVDTGGGGLVVGSIAGASRIATVTLESAGGALPGAYENRVFLGQLPEGSESGGLPPGSPFTLIGRDDEGAVVATRSLDALVKQATPH